MREIKFRGQKIGCREWIYGNIVKIDNGQCFIFNFHFIPSLSCPSDKFIEVKPESVGQFIGEKDENELDIYEGDILKITIYPYKPNSQDLDFAAPYFKNEKVVFGNYSFSLNDWLDFNYESKYEVIGNIIDNPELLAK